MDKKRIGWIVLLLLAVSVVVYGVQILVFRDARTTGFYLLQDLAFMPVTIAIATVVVGELINERQRQDRLEKTRMLTSTFFTELGYNLVQTMLEGVRCDGSILAMLRGEGDISLTEQQRRIRQADLHVTLTEPMYDRVRQLVLEGQTGLLVLSSNPLLLEHEDFTEMLWGIFHLMDEFRLRGEYNKLKEQDIEHLSEDFSRVLRYMLLHWVSNARYMRETYPNYYVAARSKLADAHGAKRGAR